MDNPYKSPRHNASIPTKSGWRERFRTRYIIGGLFALITTVIIYSGVAAILWGVLHGGERASLSVFAGTIYCLVGIPCIFLSRWFLRRANLHKKDVPKGSVDGNHLAKGSVDGNQLDKVAPPATRPPESRRADGPSE